MTTEVTSPVPPPQDSVDEMAETMQGVESGVIRPEFFNSDSDIASEYSEISSIMEQVGAKGKADDAESLTEESILPNDESKTNSTQTINVDTDADGGNKKRLFKNKPNVRMSANNINQVLPIEYPKDFTILWRDICYRVKILNRKSFKVSEKQILHNLNGEFQSGQVAAIMGPSGAGKSTFLEIIACK